MLCGQGDHVPPRGLVQQWMGSQKWGLCGYGLLGGAVCEDVDGTARA